MSIRKLEHFSLRALDGEIGRVHDFFFDDQQWTIRYLVADTRKWLPGRQVLIAPASVNRPETERHEVPVFLTMEQIRNAPGSETEQPVSRQHEMALTMYYGWPVYWSSGAVSAGGLAEPMTGAPGVLYTPSRQGTANAASEPGTAVMERKGDPHLRSTREVSGYRIHALDAPIGHVDDFLVDTASWTIRYIVVDTRNWLSGRKVLVAPQWIRDIIWEDARVTADLPREIIRTAPEYDPSAPVTRDYESALYYHYNRDQYWENE